MIHIIGEGIVPEAQAFNDVRNALEFDFPVYLGAMLAKPLGLELNGQVIYNMEYLHDESPIYKFGYLETLKRNIVLDYSKRNVEYLKSLGVEAFFMPYGYHPSLTRLHKSKKDIDVLFVGSTHFKRRSNLLDKLSKKCNVFVAQGIYGDELDRTIARAKVHLNVHHIEGQNLEVVRLNYLMANHCSIVSESSEEEITELYKNGLQFAEYDNLADACLSAIETPIDGFETIKSMPQDCKAANEWAKQRLLK
jgi:hypothetical protein